MSTLLAQSSPDRSRTTTDSTSPRTSPVRTVKELLEYEKNRPASEDSGVSLKSDLERSREHSEETHLPSLPSPRRSGQRDTVEAIDRMLKMLDSPRLKDYPGKPHNPYQLEKIPFPVFFSPHTAQGDQLLKSDCISCFRLILGRGNISQEVRENYLQRLVHSTLSKYSNEELGAVLTHLRVLSPKDIASPSDLGVERIPEAEDLSSSDIALRWESFVKEFRTTAEEYALSRSSGLGRIRHAAEEIWECADNQLTSQHKSILDELTYRELSQLQDTYNAARSLVEEGSHELERIDAIRGVIATYLSTQARASIYLRELHDEYEKSDNGNRPFSARAQDLITRLFKAYAERSDRRGELIRQMQLVLMRDYEQGNTGFAEALNQVFKTY